MKNKLTATRLREVLHYNPETGKFTRLTLSGGRVAGSVAGTKKDGYIQIRVDGTTYKAHRLAWLYMHGEWPAWFLDHKNRDRADNRIENLREASNAENMQNRVRARRDSGSGLIGAFFNKCKSKWTSKIKVDGKVTVLGYFPTAEDAHAAYMKAKEGFHPFFQAGGG